MTNNILANRILISFSVLVITYFIGWSLMVQDRVNEIYCQGSGKQELNIETKYEDMISENVSTEEE